MKIVVRYIAAELDAIAEMVYRFNHSLYGHELGTLPEFEPRALADIKQGVLGLVSRVDLETRVIGTGGYNVVVVDHEVVDDVTYIDVEFTFNAWVYGQVRDLSRIEVEVDK